MLLPHIDKLTFHPVLINWESVACVGHRHLWACICDQEQIARPQITYHPEYAGSLHVVLLMFGQVVKWNRHINCSSVAWIGSNLVKKISDHRNLTKWVMNIANFLDFVQRPFFMIASHFQT